MSGSGIDPGRTPSELRQSWPVIVACFAAALFAWGFGFTGPSIYLAELHQDRGWPSGIIAFAITAYYLLGAILLARVHLALRWLGPGWLLGLSMILLGLGASAFCRSSQPWELFPAAVLMALGWAGCTTAAIPSILALYFHQQRGAAIGLALNGASAAGFTVGPLLIGLSQNFGIDNAVPIAAAAMLMVLLPLIGLAFRHRIGSGAALPASPAAGRPAAMIRTWQFWSVALPFALALTAQVGLIVHLVSFLQPRLGPGGAATALALVSGAALAGRVLLSTVIDRLHQRWASALSMASQALALGVMLAWPQPALLYAGCVLFGASVGNLITIPSLIVQREFPPAAFGLVVGLSSAIGQFTYSLAPALLGAIRDATGSYVAVLWTCIVFQLAAAFLVLMPTRSVAAKRDCLESL